jgi:hypothetical protein
VPSSVGATGSEVLPIEAALGATGVTPGSYGDGSNVPRLTVDAQGRITSVTTLPVSGGGSSSTGGHVSGATGTLGSGSPSAYATKGLLFVPDQPILVSHLRAYIDAAATSQDHYAQIAEVSGVSGSDTVTAVLATSATLPTTSTELHLSRFALAPAVLLEAGTTYLLASGTAATPKRIAVIAPGGSLAWGTSTPLARPFGARRSSTASASVSVRHRPRSARGSFLSRWKGRSFDS